MRLLAAVAALAACESSPHTPCTSAFDFPSTECVNAALFASRASESLRPDNASIELYLEVWSRVVEAEPILENRTIQRYRNDLPTLLIYTQNPTVIDAWSRGDIVTGVPQFDAITLDLGGLRDYSETRDTGNGVFYRAFFVDHVYNEELLEVRLRATNSWLPERYEHYRDDGTWTWSGAPFESTAIIDLQFGWLDCFSGCGGMHYLRAEAQPDGDVVVYDLGGDPVPNEYVGALSPNTRPPPQ